MNDVSSETWGIQIWPKESKCCSSDPASPIFLPCSMGSQIPNCPKPSLSCKRKNHWPLQCRAEQETEEQEIRGFYCLCFTQLLAPVFPLIKQE